MQENKTPYSYRSEVDKLKLETFSFWNFFFFMYTKCHLGFSTLAV